MGLWSRKRSVISLQLTTVQYCTCCIVHSYGDTASKRVTLSSYSMCNHSTWKSKHTASHSLGLIAKSGEISQSHGDGYTVQYDMFVISPMIRGQSKYFLINSSPSPAPPPQPHRFRQSRTRYALFVIFWDSGRNSQRMRRNKAVKVKDHKSIRQGAVWAVMTTSTKTNLTVQSTINYSFEILPVPYCITIL